jgi:hypothetical protein
MAPEAARRLAAERVVKRARAAGQDNLMTGAEVGHPEAQFATPTGILPQIMTAGREFARSIPGSLSEPLLEVAERGASAAGLEEQAKMFGRDNLESQMPLTAEVGKDLGLVQGFTASGSKVVGTPSLFDKIKQGMVLGGGIGGAKGLAESISGNEGPITPKNILYNTGIDTLVGLSVGAGIPMVMGGFANGIKALPKLVPKLKSWSEGIENWAKKPLTYQLKTAWEPKLQAGKTSQFDKAASEAFPEVILNKPDAHLDPDGAIAGAYKSQMNLMSKVGDKLNEARQAAGGSPYNTNNAYKKLVEWVETQKPKNGGSIPLNELDEALAHGDISEFKNVDFTPNQLQGKITRLGYVASPTYNPSLQNQAKSLTDTDRLVINKFRSFLNEDLDNMYKDVAGAEGEQLRTLYGHLKTLQTHAENMANKVASKVPEAARPSLYTAANNGTALYGLARIAGGDWISGTLALGKSLAESNKVSDLRFFKDKNKVMEKIYERALEKLNGKPMKALPDRVKISPRPQALPKEILERNKQPSYEDILKASMFYKEPPVTQYPPVGGTGYAGPSLAQPGTMVSTTTTKPAIPIAPIAMPMKQIEPPQYYY